MEQTETPYVVGVFRDSSLAKQAIDELRHAGFRDDQMYLPGEARSPGGFLDGLITKWVGHENHESLDALTDQGVSKSDVDYYQRELEAGRTVVVVQSYGHQQEAQEILNHFGAYNATSNPSRLQEVQRIPLREEVLQAQKQPVQIGEVSIRKVVVTEEKTITVPVMREEIVVERRNIPLNSPDQAASQPVQPPPGRLVELAQNEVIRIPLYTEQIFIDKRPVIAEEVQVSKRNIQETRRFTDTVQREEPHLEQKGNVSIHGDLIEEVPQNQGEME
jgi:uncharacterized protein (TIGR02271 family)